MGSKGMERKHVCSVKECRKRYAMEYAKNNHENNCKEYLEAHGRLRR